jgi:hypothetical protein
MCRYGSRFAYTTLFGVVGSVMACTLLNLLEKMVRVATKSAVFNILQSNKERGVVLEQGLLHTGLILPTPRGCILIMHSSSLERKWFYKTIVLGSKSKIKIKTVQRLKEKTYTFYYFQTPNLTMASRSSTV